MMKLTTAELDRAMNNSPGLISATFHRRKQIWRWRSLSEIIADIALQVGFSNQSHLTQQFKRLTGITPKQIH
jgi:AraC-like DNA-binding protein